MFINVVVPAFLGLRDQYTCNACLVSSRLWMGVHVFGRDTSHTPPLHLDESAAFIEYMDISEKAAFDQLNRFMRHQRGCSILSPKRDIPKLTIDVPAIQTITVTVDCGMKKKKKLETVFGVVNTFHEKNKM